MCSRSRIHDSDSWAKDSQLGIFFTDSEIVTRRYQGPELMAAWLFIGVR